MPNSPHSNNLAPETGKISFATDRDKPQVFEATGKHIRAEIISRKRTSGAIFSSVECGDLICESVLDLCHLLLEVGHDPATTLECWRGNMMAIRIKAIGEGAKLTVKGSRFVRYTADSISGNT